MNPADEGCGAMQKAWWAAAIIVGGLAGCQSVDPADFEPAPAPPAAAAPVMLSPPQVDAVKKAVAASLGGLKNLRFSDPLVAGADSAGRISVCGFVSGRGIPGGPGEKPFVGHFFDGRFIPDKIGGGEARSKDTYSLCSQRGLGLPMAAPPPVAPGTG